jgi:poly(3-hydroxybutyrate) depolymerase
MSARGLLGLLGLLLSCALAGCTQKSGASSSGAGEGAGNVARRAAAPGAEPKASAGCNQAPGVTGERKMPVKTRTGLYIVSLPAEYDKIKPYPLGFAFHGRNRNHENCQESDCAGFQSVMKDEAVLVYMQSLREPLDAETSGWESAAEREDNAKFFELVLAELKANYCVDERRVFAAGTSSGASFSNLLGCRYGDQLLALAPVAGGLPESKDCKGAPAAVVIHGIDDPQVPLTAGEAALHNHVARAKCADSTVPPLANMHAEIRAKRDAKPSVEDAKCVDYQGCAAASPIRWCEHSYGGYDGSTHGWPAVGGRLIWDFVKGL